MNFNIVIQAVPARKPLVDELIQKLPDAIVGWDADRQGAWPTFRAAWQKTSRDMLYIQDDCVPCVNFLELVEKSIAAKPGEHIQYFNAGSGEEVYYQKAKAMGASWIRSAFIFTGQCIFLPRQDGEQFFAWAENTFEETRHNLDLRLAIWRVLQGKSSLRTVPELVEQLAVKSAIGGRIKGTCLRSMFNEDPNLVFNQNEMVDNRGIYYEVAKKFILKHAKQEIFDEFCTNYATLRQTLRMAK